MTDTKPQLPSYADPLGETLHMLKLNGTLYCRSELTAPWGIDLPPIEGCMMFHIVTAGRGWLEVEGEEPVLLETGSLTLVPHGAGHVIRSSADCPAEPLFDIPVERVSDRYEIMRHGGGGEYTHSICVVVRFDHVAAERLVALLPRIVQVDAWDSDAESWLQSTLRFIAREAKELRPGGETVITHLSDILVIQAIRSWLATAPAADQGWLAALRDGQIGRALAMIHRTPDRDWSVEGLAREVGMSRSAFSARFTELVGEPVMRYVTQWRMQLARTQILEGAVPLAALARQMGYQSEAAFSRAFKRMFGMPPGKVRRAPPLVPGQIPTTD
ncbi:AraC family transcriptional regulator [Hoeflea poritis]|uniref:AraC family transcriptional regulator n=1 Tax=Hoeflea poritis TaxID=2993659 RepID=A0ABT4VN96_9HYPH|nr:AraC family transcriptional regulator [Hoeflea poritis]MDA4845640.1 AraC family transcriptional regulator [Hoeflea poritis]